MDYNAMVQRLLAMNNPQLTARFNSLQPGQGEAMYNQYMQRQSQNPLEAMYQQRFNANPSPAISHGWGGQARPQRQPFSQGSGENWGYNKL